MLKVSLSLAAVFGLALSSPVLATAQSGPEKLPESEVSADLGPCSALLIVTGSDSKPIYLAKMTTRIQYGPLGIKRLDLEAYTGVDGRLNITKLPETLKKPMFIHIAKEGRAEMVEFKPDLRCHATFEVQLQ
jgi:hypothetical protein